MVPRKYKLFVATFSYAGNGGCKSQHPDVGRWLRDLDRKLMKDQRISDVVYEDISDTPITLNRNKAVLRARATQCDLVLMVDSDMRMDAELEYDRTAKPFWDSSFDFLDSMYETMPVVIGSPYCGGGGDGSQGEIENVFVFRWQNCVTDNPHEVDMQLEAYSRVEATMMTGIREVGALPTGGILYDMRVFDLLDPMPRWRELRNVGLTAAEADRATQHFFDYEWVDATASEKGSTEDVQNTRDISLAGIHVYGRNPVFCNWDAWAGHWKPKLVRKPRILTADSVSRSLVDVVRRGNESGVKIETVDFTRRPGDRSVAQVVGQAYELGSRGLATAQVPPKATAGAAVTKATDTEPLALPHGRADVACAGAVYREGARE